MHDPLTYERGVPYEVLGELRREHGIVWVRESELPGWPGGPGYWLVLRYQNIREVLSDPATYSSALGGTQVRDPATGEDLAFVRRMMLNMDPPEHTRIRRLLARSFTPRAIGALERRISGHAKALVDRMLAGPEVVDFVKDVSADLPLLALADILGVPGEDRWLLFDWANRVIGWQDPEYAVSSAFAAEDGSSMARDALRHRPSPGPDGRMPDPRTRAGMLDLYSYAHLLGAAKRAAPGSDVMSVLMSARDDEGDGKRVTLEEFENLFWLFAVAGNETLRNGIPGGMLGLVSEPEVQRAVRADLTLVPALVEEMLRWWTPVMTFRRTATRDTVLAGQRVARGEKVVVSFASGNRDEQVFTEPDRFWPHRYAVRGLARARPHLAFGHGPHICIGAVLARSQMTALFTELLSRTGWLEAAGEPVLLRSSFQRGLKRLPVRWMPAP